MSPGPNRNVQSLSAASVKAASSAPGRSCRRPTTPSTKMTPAAYESARWSGSAPPSHDDMPACIHHRGRDDPFAATPPQCVSDLRNLLAVGELPGPVGVANRDERRRHSLFFPPDLAQWLRTSGHDGRRAIECCQSIAVATIPSSHDPRIEERELEAGALS
jgi:hypothetical protein